MYFKIKGEVIPGNKIGRRLGFPTANIAIPDGLAVKDGVYAGKVRFEGAAYGAMINVGRKPSVDDSGPRLIEAHIFDFNGDLYGKKIDVELLKFIRDEEKFPSLDILQARIAEDKKVILALLRK